MDIQEQANKETVRYGIKASELSAKALGKVAMFLIERHLAKEPVGEVEYKKFLKRSDCDLKTLSLKNADIKLMSKIAKSYGIGFAVMKAEGEKDYTLFFKAKNEVLLSESMKKYLSESLKRQQEQQKEKSEPKHAKEKVVPDKTKSDIDVHRFKRPPIRERLKLASQKAYQINKQRAVELDKIKHKELSR